MSSDNEIYIERKGISISITTINSNIVMVRLEKSMVVAKPTKVEKMNSLVSFAKMLHGHM